MRKIKTYEDFVNEELNWKKAVAGAALGASLLGGMSSCKKTDIKPTQIPVEQTSTSTSNTPTPVNIVCYINI